MSMDAPGLARCWFEFDLSEHEPEVRPGLIRLDGGTDAWRLLARGAGVTGYDEGDCLELVRRALGEDLPPVISTVRDVVIDDVFARQIANPVWRGTWFPPLNIRANDSEILGGTSTMVRFTRDKSNWERRQL